MSDRAQPGPHRGVPREERTSSATSILRHRALLELASQDKSDFEAALRHILRTDAELLGLERVNCWRLDPESSRLVCVCGYVRSENAFESGETLSESELPAYFQALVDDPVILANAAHLDPRTSELTKRYLLPNDISSMMDVPIWLRGSLWGVVCHEAVGRPRIWSHDERDFAVSIGHIVSMALEARSRADAERVARLSELFMAILSHDLRTPLATISESARYLLELPADEVTLAAEQRIARNANRMTRMIAHLLDFSRIRLTGQLPITRVPTDLGDLCHRQLADIATIHPGRCIDFSVRGQTTGDWDPDRLEQLVSNLLGNALEHGVAGGRVWMTVDGTDPDVVVIEIGNQGTLPAEFTPVIFDPFRRLEVQRARPDGLGLGLFIAREIVHAHGGTIQVDTRPQDTLFVVRLQRSTFMH